MRSRSGRALATLLILAAAESAASGCGGAPRRAPAFRLQEEQARAGRKAWAKGDARAAIAAQERALLAARSIEDEEGIALRVLDLAALRRAVGEPADALAVLAELLADPPPLPYPAPLRAEAARLAGVLALDGQDPAAGARWANRAVELCRPPRCGRRGAMVNLQARAAFLAGDHEQARRLAERALPLNRAAKDDGERANSSRIIADAELALGRPEAASDAYADALAVDKKLGREGMVFLDLAGLGRAAQRRGRADEARRWFERARAAALAAGDERSAAAADALSESQREER
ncbi:MAG TPA: tetratricopeptide repeat protein [Candidatus Methanoperedens sp.]|nr:tetratricopeptide repeat protein [Candidatus Methanoperedens sp.]